MLEEPSGNEAESRPQERFLSGARRWHPSAKRHSLALDLRGVVGRGEWP